MLLSTTLLIATFSAAPTVNLLPTNADFEAHRWHVDKADPHASTLAGWHVIGFTGSPTDAFTGVIDDQEATPQGNFLYLAGGVLETADDALAPVVGGRTYTLTFKARNDSGATYGYAAALVFRDADGRVIGGRADVFGEYGDGTKDQPFDTHTIVAEAPNAAVAAAIRVSVDTNGIAVFDQFELTEGGTVAPIDIAVPEHRKYGAWRQSAINGGGYVMSVVPAPGHPNIVYAWTDVGGFHRSDDGGDTWKALHAGLEPVEFPTRGNLYIRGLVVDPRDPDIVIAASGYRYSPPTGLHRSTDGGKTWDNVLSAPFFGDFGKAAGKVLVRDPNDADRLLVGTAGGGLHESTDNGATWSRLDDGKLDRRLVLDIDIDHADPQRVWVVAGGFDETVGVEMEPFVEVLPDGRARMERGFFVSNDGGRTFESLDELPSEIAQDPVAPDTLYGLFDQLRVKRSTDGGATWKLFIDGLNTNLNATGWDPQPFKYRAIGVGPDFVLVHPTKGGTTYRIAAGTDGPWEALPMDNLVVPDNWWGGTIERPSENSGWDNLFSDASDIVVDPNDPTRWWVSDWHSIFVTQDAGRTWTWKTDGLEDVYVQVVSADPHRPDVVHVGLADIGYFRSTDGGRTFLGRTNNSDVTNNVDQLAISKADAFRIYATGPTPPGGGWYANQLFISDDAGMSWRASPMEGLPGGWKAWGGHPGMNPDQFVINTVVVEDDDADRVWVSVAGTIGKGGGVYVSDDGGESFRDISDGLPDGEPFFRMGIWQSTSNFDVSSDGSQVAIRAPHGGGSRVFRRGSSDEPFVEVAPFWDGKLLQLIADPHVAGRFWIAAAGEQESRPGEDPSRIGTFRSDDGGVTWTQVAQPDDAPGAAHIILDRNVPGRMAVSTRNGLIYSTDAGASWIRLDAGLTDRAYWNMGAFAGDHLVVGTGGSGVFWIDLPSE